MTTSLSSSEDTDDLDHAHHRAVTALWLGGLGATLAVVLVVATGLGPVWVPPGTVARIVGHHLVGVPADVDWTASQDSIVWLVRVPRVLLGALVGAALAVAGAVLQTLVRNVLADPHVLGVTSGASTGAATSLLFAGTAATATALAASAFAGALTATVLLFAIARINGQMTSLRLLLGGVTIGYLFSAATSFLIFASDNQEGARTVLFWLLGSLSSAAWSSVATTALVTATAVGALLLLATRLDILAGGDDTARALGLSPARFRMLVLAVVALAIGAVVAVAGAIGFVGLIVPHIARLCGGGTHRRLIPFSAVLGAVFLVVADVVARVVFAPRELPLGIVTAVVGAPLLLVLIRRHHNSPT
ncbi:iron ABC transporter permease [Nocardia sp. BSTN01]|uniref:FecCD family ABC transporter permease n=1 Tax=Nocardia sp. BSTN01 TaxID=2783665 RepID=UPI00188EA4A2|nr:iron ABC transporter permease [Nocardia sp. BSTN01]MBF5001841.1 iron ABC transporter permease [Nocardia sp. BSTN01]